MSEETSGPSPHGDWATTAPPFMDDPFGWVEAKFDQFGQYVDQKTRDFGSYGHAATSAASDTMALVKVVNQAMKAVGRSPLADDADLDAIDAAIQAIDDDITEKEKQAEEMSQILGLRAFAEQAEAADMPKAPVAPAAVQTGNTRVPANFVVPPQMSTSKWKEVK